MRTPNRPELVALAAIGVAGVSLFALTRFHPRKALPKLEPTIPNTAPDLSAFVEKNKNSKDPKVQDKVGDARLHLAYLQVHESFNGVSKKVAFEKARQTFLTTAKEYKGQGKISADFGGVPDQAAYQAACCLVGEGKSDEARKEFIAFLKQRQLSPLCQACYSRLVRLNGGKSTREYEDMLQAAITAQDKHARFETSVCGPKAIAYALPLLGKPKASYQDISKLCGTTDKGTTVEGLRKGLKALGVQSFGVQVNSDDFVKLPFPAIYLKGDHYLVLKSIDGHNVSAYDPYDDSETSFKAPKPDDPDFLATVITFSLPSLNSK